MKAVRMILVAVLGTMLTFFVVGGGSPASAIGLAAAPTDAGTCGAYPPDNLGASMSVSTTTPFPGQTITLTGVHFTPGDITIVLDTGAQLAAVTVPASGEFSVGIKMPAGVTGNHLILVEGYDGVCPPDPVQITIQTSGAGGGGLASTGVDILTGLAIAIALIAGGVLFARSGRRARSHH